MIRSTTSFWQHLLIACLVVITSQAFAAGRSQDDIFIGVLTYNGHQQALTRWKPTADYLTRHIYFHRFKIVPLTHEEFTHAINKDQLDFILTNPGLSKRSFLPLAPARTLISTGSIRDMRSS